jgi:hypothetical protein
MHVETVEANGVALALLITDAAAPSDTTFVTPDEANLQVGFVVRAGNGIIDRHVHHPVERRVTGTSEVLAIRQGSLELDLYDDDRQLVATRELHAGDVIVLMNGGHGIRTIEDVVLLEIKQGPYSGVQEKERF